MCQVPRRLMLDLRPLRVSPEYRRMWVGWTVAQVGQSMAAVAVGIQVYAITGSSFAVGMIGLAAFFPLVVFGLYGGSISDTHDRRQVALWSSAGLWLCSLVLVAQAWLAWDRVWLLYVVIAAESAFFAVNTPARSAIVPRLIEPSLLPAANALTTMTFSAGFMLGPLLGGLVIDAYSLTAAYAIDALLFAAAMYGLFRLPAIAPEAEAHRTGWAAVWEGLRFLSTRRNLLMTFMVDLCAMVLAQPRALFPALAATTFGGGARTVGFLAAAPAVGSVLAGLLSGWLGTVRRQGLMVVVMVCGYGASVAFFGLTDILTWALFFLALTGAADMVSAVFRSTILQVATPDELRGRLQGVFVVVVAGGPRLGDAVIGTTAGLFGEHAAIVTGGVACIAATLFFALRNRGFVRYDARDPVA
ncbi:MAG: MFS transporter [Actinomycetia bacterium]|nr:MFS transporter [Actinomycetes bacterium]